jgi:hypothetical protein
MLCRRGKANRFYPERVYNALSFLIRFIFLTLYFLNVAVETLEGQVVALFMF